jgi:predicted transcriptional regulator of viral defense system
MVASRSVAEARSVFLSHGGMLRASEAVRLGVHPTTLYAMRDAGDIERLSRGVYRLSDLAPLSNPDLATVGLRVPQGVVCLISALYYHDLTTEIPRWVDLALARGGTAPRLDGPPIRVYWFSGRAFTAGVGVHQIDGVPVRVYSPEKSIADCFKYRAKLGLDVALEALKLYLGRSGAGADALLRAAAVCRVANLMQPYVEALL